MKNVLIIDSSGEQLMSSIDDSTNRLFINDDEIDSSLWVGDGDYMDTVNGQLIIIEKTPDTDGNIIIVKLSDYHYALRKSSNSGGGGSGGVTSYLDLTDKPKIEGVTLEGDKTHEDLNLQRISNSELEEMLTL